MVGTVNLVEEEDHGGLTRGLEPVWRVPRGASVVHAGQTDEVTLGHLRGTSLHDGDATVISELIDHLGLADTVATTERMGLRTSVTRGATLRNVLKSIAIVVHLAWVGWWLYYT